MVIRVCRRACSGLFLEIDVGERLPVAVADDEALPIQLWIGLLDGPWRLESGCSGCSTVNTERPNCGLSAELEGIRCAYCAFGFSDGVGAVPVGAGFCFFFFFGGGAAGC